MSNIYAVWHGACDKAKLNSIDTNTHRRKVHPHVLRKFFSTRLGSVIVRDIVEALMGHEAYLTRVYRRYTEEQLAEEYLKGEHTLSVFTDVEEVSRLRQEVKEGLKEEEKRSKEVQATANRLMNRYLALAEQLEKPQSDSELIKKVTQTERLIEYAKFITDDEQVLEARRNLRRKGVEICLECGGERRHYDKHCSLFKEGKYANKLAKKSYYTIPSDRREGIKKLLEKKKK